MSADPIPPFWLVWNPSGRSPVYEHPSYESARHEAERLARGNAGNRFYVLAPCARGGYDPATIIWSHYQPTGCDTVDEFEGEHSPHAAGVE